jgi:hypothetical protein
LRTDGGPGHELGAGELNQPPTPNAEREWCRYGTRLHAPVQVIHGSGIVASQVPAALARARLCEASRRASGLSVSFLVARLRSRERRWDSNPRHLVSEARHVPRGHLVTRSPLRHRDDGAGRLMGEIPGVRAFARFSPRRSFSRRTSSRRLASPNPIPSFASPQGRGEVSHPGHRQDDSERRRGRLTR